MVKRFLVEILFFWVFEFFFSSIFFKINYLGCLIFGVGVFDVYKRDVNLYCLIFGSWIIKVDIKKSWFYNLCLGASF